MYVEGVSGGERDLGGLFHFCCMPGMFFVHALQCAGDEVSTKVEFHDASERMKDIDSKLGALAKEREAENNFTIEGTSNDGTAIPTNCGTHHLSGNEVDMLVAQYKMEQGTSPIPIPL